MLSLGLNIGKFCTLIKSRKTQLAIIESYIMSIIPSNPFSFFGHEAQYQSGKNFAFLIVLKISKIHGEQSRKGANLCMIQYTHLWRHQAPFATSVQVSHKKVSLAALYSMTVVSHYVHYKLDLTRVQVWSLTQLYSVDFSKSRIGVKKVRFQQTHNQGLRQLLLTVSWDLHN